MSNLRIAIIGASGGIGSAFVQQLTADPSNKVYAFARSSLSLDQPNVTTGSIDFEQEHTIEAAAKLTTDAGPLDLVVVTAGILHDQGMMPEKSLRELSAANFEKNFLVNTIGPALVAKHFLPLLHRDKRAVFAALSARVGSIADNRLGGWYAYRSAKSALNMFIKTTSIELARRYQQAIIVGLHPGTVDSNLSTPFQKNVPEGKLFTPDYSAEQLIKVIGDLTPEDSGKIFAWDGSPIPY